MKKTILLLAFFAGTVSVSGQAARLNVFEKKGQENIPVAGINFEITFSDTIKTEMTSASNGFLGKFPLTKGKYTVLVSAKGFKDSKGEIIIEDKKTTTLDLICTRKTEDK